MSDNALGLPDEPNPEVDGDDPFANSPVVEDTEPAPEAEVEEEVQPAPEEIADPAVVGESEPEEEVEPETAEDSVEEPEVDWQKRFNDTRELQRRTAEEARQTTEQLRQAQEYLKVAAAVIQQERAAAAQRPTGPDPDTVQRAEQLGIDPEVLTEAQRIADERAAAAIAPMQEQMSRQQQEQAAYLAWQQESMKTGQFIAQWKSQNQIDEATENTMVEVFNDLTLDEKDPVMYDVALEAARDPHLLNVLKAAPDFVTTEEGMALARQLASVSGPTSQKTASRNTPAARQRAHVETGGSGAAPSAQERPKDAWDRVLEKVAEEQGTGSSILGV